MAQVNARYTVLPLGDPEAGEVSAAAEPEVSWEPRCDDDANCLEQMLFSWATPMIDVGYKRALQTQDLYPVAVEDKTDAVSQRWHKAWAALMKESRSWNSYLGKGHTVTDDHGNTGVLRWVGTLMHAPEGATSILYAGVEWDRPRRAVKHGQVIGGDGWYKGEKLFDCKDGHGSFIRPHLLRLGASRDSMAPAPVVPHPEAPAVWRGLARAFGWRFAQAGAFKLINDVSIFIGPICLQLIIKFLKSDDPTWGRGIGIAALLLGAQIAQSFAMNQYFYGVARVGMQMRQALSCAVFDKGLRLSSRARSTPEFDIGRIVNMMSTDAQRANDVVQTMHQLWSAPFQIIVSCVLLYRLVGVPLFAGIGVMLLLSPLQSRLMNRMMRLRTEINQFSDKRVQGTSELFSGIRIVKFMVWGDHFRNYVQGRRNEEVDKLRQNQNTRVLMFFMVWLTPLFLSATVFIIYAVTGGDFTSDVIFPALQLFNILRFPFLMLPLQFSFLSQAKVSFDRLVTFLASPEVDEEGTHAEGLTPEEKQEYAIMLQNGTFQAYEPQPIPWVATTETGLERLRPSTSAELEAATAPATALAALAAAAALQQAGRKRKSAARCFAPSGGKDRAAPDPAPGAAPARPGAAAPAGGKGQAKSGPGPAAGKGAPAGKGKGGKGKGKGAGLMKLEPKVVLKDINLGIRAGKLTVIVGPTGCGKSCLLDAMLGGLDHVGSCRLACRGQQALAGFSSERIGYAPQQAWIMNGTLKDNITFFQGTPDGDEFYQKVIEACQLGPDLQTLQDGDQTEIGEKGINLSGGQKARVSLARAVYSRCETYFLDDPLSAVDPHVGGALMSGVIGSAELTRPQSWPEHAMLSGTTRVLVTHQLPFLRHADDIVVMKDGQIARIFRGSAGTPAIDVALADEQWDGADFLAELRRDARRADAEMMSPAESPAGSPRRTPMSKALAVPVTDVAAPPQKDKGKLVSDEERAQGSVEWRMYAAYVKAAGGSLWISFALSLFILNQGALTFGDLWLTWWTDSENDDNTTSHKDPPIGGSLSSDTHLFLYVGIVAGAAIINLLRGIVAYSRFSTASKNFHYDLLANVIRAPISYFDTTPLGRLINRFSKDLDQIDNILPPTIVSFFQLTFQTTAQMAVMVSSQPLVLAAFVPAGVVYIGILKRFIRTNRETKRLDSINKSPVYTHFTETLNGIKTIQAFRVEDFFRKDSRRKLDLNTQTTFANVVCNRWLAIRLELLGNLVCLIMVMLAVVTRMESSSINSSSIGLLSLGITYSLSLTQALNFLVRQCADLEAQMNGVERVVEYTTDIDQEPRLEYSSTTKLLTLDGQVGNLKRGDQLFKEGLDGFAIVRVVTKDHVEIEIPQGENRRNAVVPVDRFAELGYVRTTVPHLPSDWPAKRDVVFDNVQMRYRQGLELVLKGLRMPGSSEPLVVADGDKVGVVGRTGAGKSTLMLALFRFVELAGGRILIGGRDISTVALEDLRGSIAMIPQDPLLFRGTVRENLDPFHQSSDERLWEALINVGMQERIRDHDEQLNGQVTEGGQNFSVGQRQLLCLARAWLKQGCGVLVMDEATASIDHLSDMLIQKTVREKFKNYTTLTIAHRLQTIMDSTRVLVLQQGHCIEYDTPQTLLEDEGGELRGMAEQTGDFARLLKLARGDIKVEDALEELFTEQREVGAPTYIMLAAVVVCCVVRHRRHGVWGQQSLLERAVAAVEDAMERSDGPHDDGPAPSS
eukprot:TRINITY_DN9190_c0_g1_i1.p1 TRINITY_DN9190_c0_g1~~TRINITY_DN9190_c0_g1_i1.p1  ORF type:complete len:1730 (+),score=536.57 TRINITY_DN9190_c0_g1_i1:112-5301(+)